ncbi:MAG: TIGR03032 family protein, partial [Pirellulaceae bacterium]
MSDSLSSTATPSGSPPLELFPSRHFAGWLGEHQISLALTTYQAGKLFLIGIQPDGRLSVFERTFNRCMGLWGNGQTLWMTSLFQLWRFENALQPQQFHDGYDRLYVPRVGYTTGDLDIHDVAVDAKGRVLFVNTLFSCLATVSETHSFVPLWQPPFVSKLAAEERCHLNGLALDQGVPRYVTAVAATDSPDAWREHRRNGGVVVDCVRNELVADALSMPHSPRVYRDQLWLLNAGTGFFGRIDRKSGLYFP